MASTFAFDAIGTAWRVDSGAELDPATQRGVLELIEEYDAVYSRFRADSGISTLAQAGGSLTLPAHGAELGTLYGALYRITRGSMSPLVGAVLEHQGYDAAYSLTPRGPASAAAGHDDVLVDASGDMLHRGPRALTVALEHPYDATSAIGTVVLENRALCASASNRRAWGDGLHHVVDAATGSCVDRVVATWVLAADAMTADALATALFLAEPEDLSAEFEFDYVQVFSDGRARYSPPLNGALF
ncbi:FAD:protein FMN transferase [Arthrobacter sp. Br18]|uniref:FAD:protein FMN transferase n=1 Tax=Arthrobacter sp. Br18 TaxID=1312954 RepID=UPI00047BD423|nr:FAD:protein FMN transferase [Arthrobacter sp. Br18]